MNPANPSAARIDADELLRNAAWLQALSRRLVHDVDIADDVVHETIVAAISTPPHAATPVRPWLARVARNLSFRALRDASRRARHERASISESAPPTPEETATRAEAFRDVADAVRALDPIYREVVLLRFFDGLDARDVAARLGVPVETVRTRLKRAVALLRERLDAKYGRRDAWAVVLGVPTGTGGRARPYPPRPRVGSGSAALRLVAGGVAMSAAGMKVVIGAALVAAGLVALMLMRDHERPRAPAPLSDASTARAEPGPVLPRARAHPERESRPAPEEATKTAEPASPASTWTLVVDVVGPGEAPLGGTALRIRPWSDDGQALEGEVSGVTGPSGHAAFDVSGLLSTPQRPRSFRIEADHPDHLPRTVTVAVPSDRGAAISSRIQLERAAIVTGVVEDDQGRLVRAANVIGFDAPTAASRSSHASVLTGDGGRFRLRIAPDVQHDVVAVAQDLVPAVVRMTVPADLPRDVGVVTLGAGVSLSGSVVDGDGRPLARVKVLASPVWRGATLRDRAWQGTWSEAAGAAHWPAVAVTDEQGRFRMSGLSAGDHRVELDVPGGTLDLRTALVRQVEVPGADARFIVGAARLVIDVATGGAPVPRAEIAIEAGGQTTGGMSDAGGRRSLLVAAGVEHTIQVKAPGYETANVVVPPGPAGSEHSVRVEIVPLLPRGTIVVRVRSDDGVSPERLRVELRGLEAGHGMTKDVTAEDGTFRVDAVEAGRYRATLRPGGVGRGNWLPLEVDVEVRAGDTTTVEAAAHLGGRLRISVKDAAGGPIAAKCVIRNSEGVALPVAFVLVADGGGYLSSSEVLAGASNFDVDPPLPAGRYRVEVSAEAREPIARDVVLEVGKTAEVSVVVAER